MTEEQKEKYLKQAGTKCTYCESEDLLASGITNDSSCAWENITCETCHKEWTDEYTLTGVEDIQR